MWTSKPKTTAAILLISAAVLSLLVYRQYFSSRVVSSVPVPDMDKNLTETQKELFYFPTASASQAEQLKHYDLAAKSAVAADYIEVKDCVAKPDVFRVMQGSNFTVKNTGTKDFKFVLKSGLTTVAAGTTLVAKADFRKGPGLYGYGCGDPNMKRSIGLILVVPPKL